MFAALTALAQLIREVARIHFKLIRDCRCHSPRIPNMRCVCNDGLDRDVFGKRLVVSVSDDTPSGIDDLFMVVFFRRKRRELLVLHDL